MNGLYINVSTVRKQQRVNKKQLQVIKKLKESFVELMFLYFVSIYKEIPVMFMEYMAKTSL